MISSNAEKFNLKRILPKLYHAFEVGFG